MPSRYFKGHQTTPDPLEQHMLNPGQIEFDEVFQVSIDPAIVQSADFDLPVHQCMYEFWLENRMSGGLPSYKAIDPLSFRPAVGFVHVVEPNNDGSDFMYRLFATAVVEIAGRDMTGKWFSESPVPSWQFYRRQLAACVSLRVPVYSENNADYQVSTLIKWCRLLLPMVDDQGNVNRILVPNVPIDRRDEP